MRSIVLGLGLLLPLFANARAGLFEKGFLEIRPGYRLYVEHRVAQKGKPTIFCLNGLTWSTRDWNSFVAAYDKIDPGVGFVLYDMKGMGQTLLSMGPVRETITLEEQLQDLVDLEKKLKIDGQINVIGLSYGGGLALLLASKYPHLFDQIVAVSPFIARITAQDDMIRKAITWTRTYFPANPMTDDELYDFYLRNLVYSTYPLAEPVVTENGYKLEAIFRMVQGARKFSAKSLAANIRRANVHVMGAINDPYVLDTELKDFWASLNGKGLSYLRVTDTGHKIPTERPELVASWLKQILNKNPELYKGLEFLGDAIKAEARAGNVTIPLSRVGFCETILRNVFGPLQATYAFPPWQPGFH